MNQLKKVLSLFLISAMTLGLVGCGGKEEESQVHIGYFNNVTHAQALYLKSNWTLEESLGEDTEVKWTAFNAAPF